MPLEEEYGVADGVVDVVADPAIGGGVGHFLGCQGQWCILDKEIKKSVIQTEIIFLVLNSKTYHVQNFEFVILVSLLV